MLQGRPLTKLWGWQKYGIVLLRDISRIRRATRATGRDDARQGVGSNGSLPTSGRPRKRGYPPPDLPRLSGVADQPHGQGWGGGNPACGVGPSEPCAHARGHIRSARVSRPRRSTDRRSPGNAPTVGDGGRRGRVGQEALAEPAWKHSQVTAMGQSDPCLVPHTGNGATVVRGLVSTRRGSEELGMIAPFWPGACATRLQQAAPFGSWLQGPGVNLQWGHGDEAVEDVLRDE